MIEKYGVVIDPQEGEKTAADHGVCPACGSKLQEDSNVPKCPKCGTSPFERAPSRSKDGNEKEDSPEKGG